MHHLFINIKETRLSFCLPKPEPPQLPFNLDIALFEKITVNFQFFTNIFKEYHIQLDIVENKPEAPWIKKEQNCLIFTENMQIIDEPELRSEQTGTLESVEKLEGLKNN